MAVWGALSTQNLKAVAISLGPMEKRGEMNGRSIESAEM
ncbi:hypothetical protein FOPG_16486 [Fusarium oxysporum f. sp. conglutinans race 2 54008]|uniref:Uncharacterized protein n=2 Tax=Fusarium oxysporum TaxID=5507 RepID=A0A4Q2UWQ3_FUSOX|nr:hypothetical protein FOPG_16486 [Fusarium oxysporum f. sp. conglutinans race 2 54008]RYC78791.1 hypothetical protein BFJ63_vAg18336 [Fusarium oxysporum f. sp. narcissi]